MSALVDKQTILNFREIDSRRIRALRPRIFRYGNLKDFKGVSEERRKKKTLDFTVQSLNLQGPAMIQGAESTGHNPPYRWNTQRRVCHRAHGHRDTTTASLWQIR
ncbi:hypothetical protein Pan241w_16980 [Gimesia alba]|uniref:Uncharacterized protein n=1 Tax=Gimesia alba TaxID=2527973 RepID=A0A517RCN5_9PLAN|nr:hypothetical protein Pan241w_16980 [Gimesia alba]